jgi:tape measure domain-containing protein
MFDYSVKFSAVDKISEKINAINEKMESMSNRAKQASSKIKNELGNIKLTSEFKLKIQNALDGIDKIKNKMDGFRNTGKEIFQKGVSFLTSGALTTPLLYFVNQFSKIEDATASFTPLLGGVEKANELVQKLNETASTTPFQFETLASQAQQLLPIMNGDIQKVIETTRMLGDTAGGNAQKLDSITRGFTKAMLKGKVDMESLNMIGEAGVPIFDQLAKTMGLKVNDAFFKMISAGEITTNDLTKAFKKMTSEGGLFYKGMEIASETTSGKWSTLKDNVALTSAKIGEVLAPTVKETIDKFTEIAQKVKSWVEQNKELVKTITKWTLIIGGALLTLGALYAIVGIVSMAIGGLTFIFTGLSFVIKAVQLATVLFNATLWANPITWIIAGVIALIGAIVALIYYWEDITKWVGTLWDKFTGFVASLNIVENAIGGVRAVFETLTAPIRYVNELIDSFLSKFEIYNKAKAKVQDVAGAIENQASNAWENTKSFFGFGNEAPTQDGTQIDNTNKNHTVVDVNIQATGGTVTEQNAQSNGGRVKLNTASNGV